MIRTVTQRVFSSEAWAALHEAWEDGPEKFEILAALLARGRRPAFGSVTIEFERGRITLIREHVTHK